MQSHWLRAKVCITWYLTVNNGTAQGGVQEQGQHQRVLPWQTLHNLRTSWTTGIIFVFSCLRWILLPQTYLLFLLTMLPASVGRGSPCSCSRGGSEGSFPLWLLLGTLECTDFLLPCSQPKRNRVLFTPVFFPFYKIGHWGCCFLLRWQGNPWAENLTCVRPQEQQCQKKGFNVGIPHFTTHFVWLGGFSCY